MSRTTVTVVAAGILLAVVLWPQRLFSHETLTTTVLYDREIVRVLDKHCVMCHAENRLALPLTTYEQTWLQGRRIRAEVIARHMPPWAAVPGYGRFANDNSLTLRETQFVVSWVEGLGPRNAGTVFRNIADASGAPAAPSQTSRTPASAGDQSGRWRVGEPSLILALPAQTVAPQQNRVVRVVIESGLTVDRRIRALEYSPGDRRVVRAAFFSVQETGQWIGSWTPWYGFVELPAGTAYRIPARAHVVAEIHYRGAGEPIVDAGTLGLAFAKDDASSLVSDLVIEPLRDPRPGRTGTRLRNEARVDADTDALAVRADLSDDITSLEVSARRPDGGTDVLLFAKDFPRDWPTPYIFAEPVRLRRGTRLVVTAYSGGGAARASVRVSTARATPPRRSP
jgi:hypothetical protein